LLTDLNITFHFTRSVDLVYSSVIIISWVLNCLFFDLQCILSVLKNEATKGSRGQKKRQWWSLEEALKWLWS